MKKQDTISIYVIIFLFSIGICFGMVGTFIWVMLDGGHVLENNGLMYKSNCKSIVTNDSENIEAYVQSSNQGICLIRLDNSCNFTPLICQTDINKTKVNVTL